MGSGRGQHVLKVPNGAEVLFSQEWDDAARIAAMEIHEDVAGRISRAVLSDDDFIVKINALVQDAV
jgi:hypothetical protein